MDIICTDGYFDSGAMKFYDKYGVIPPTEGTMYNIREVTKHTNGKTGITLEELKNPGVPFDHPVLGKIMKEPTWDIKRFSTLMGDEISREQIEEVLVHTKKKVGVFDN